MKGQKTTFFVVCPSSSQPRYFKRVESLRRIATVRVFAFERLYYKKNEFKKQIDLTVLGNLTDKSYLLRVFRLYPAIKLLKQARTACYSPPALYAFSFDCYLIARLAGIKRGIIEIADINTINSRFPFLRRLEEYVIRDSKAVVVTSPSYETDYYQAKKKWSKPVYLIENRLPRAFQGKRPPPQKVGEPIRIGLIGLLRYTRPIEMLIRYVKRQPRFELHCYGDGPCKELVVENACSNIWYHGEFKNPADLSRVYSNVDINFVVYDRCDRNVDLLLPNKLYESIYYSKPIVCSEGTALADVVMGKNIGLALSIEIASSFEERLDTIERSWIEQIAANCYRIPESSVIDDSDVTLGELLSEID